MRKLACMQFCLAFAAAWLAAHAAQAEIVIKERTQYYPISGKDGYELSRSMLEGAAGPINKRHAIAATAAEYQIGDADIVVRNGRCVVRDVTLVLDITYHMPRWRDEKRANANLRKIWRTFYSELVRHENTHGEIARKGARELEAALKRISGTVAFNCNDFGTFATTRLNFLAMRLRQRHDAFDRRENFVTSRIARLQASLARAR